MRDGKTGALRWRLSLPRQTWALDFVHTGDRIYLATSQGLLCVADDPEAEPARPGFVLDATPKGDQVQKPPKKKSH